MDPPPKAFFFDVFGTCVDWRSTVTNALYNAAQETLSSTQQTASNVRSIAENMTREDWGDIAEEWRQTYLVFTRKIASDPTIPYKTIDQHHLDALREILVSRGLTAGGATGSLWNDDEVTRLSLVWHYLDPWADTCQGISELNKLAPTCTLSNGNVSLLQDMVKHAGMDFTHVFSAEMFQSYKPSPKVYLGAVGKVGLKAEECCMVAAHLNDLKAAKANGMKTIYVERPQEERHSELKGESGLVDLWVGENEDGFIAVARKLGIESKR